MPELHPNLIAAHRALAAGDMTALREAVRSLDQKEREILEARIGASALARLERTARGGRRAKLRGRVVVIHGIMGSNLDVTDGGGDSDRVWVSLWRLAKGRISDLALAASGQPLPSPRVDVAGLFPLYLPLITELSQEWAILPFAFDWRLDIDDSARRMAAAVGDWSHGEPVHVIAHSMGGLVTRRMMQLAPDVWATMLDPKGTHPRGGRLIMLGTPNRGSMAIPLAFSGEESLVRKLALLDLPHSLGELLEILCSFVGSYQMLPAPEPKGDDRLRLYDRAEWGSFPVTQRHLDKGRAFQEALAQVVTPERLVYVAGYDQETPYRITVRSPGRFEYQTTADGDGRVPHELGLLDGVSTFWVKEAHGDLPKNDEVLNAITDLLLTGTTTALKRQRPRSRARGSTAWRPAEQFEHIDAEFKAVLAAGTRGGVVTDERQAARAEALLVEEYLGTPGRRTAEPTARRRPEGVRRAALTMQVVWGDITKVRGDVYAVGHYRGVLPQNAELAMDRVVSPKNGDEGRLVLTSLTRQGVLRGDLGDIKTVPWADRSRRFVAVAGMGYPGTFGRAQLVGLIRNLTLAIAALPRVRRVCSVLIGSGAGNLPIPVAVDGMVAGLIEAIGAGAWSGTLREVQIVEMDYWKARQIREALDKRGKPDKTGSLRLRVPPLKYGPDASIGEYGLELLVGAAALAESQPKRRKAVTQLLTGVEPRHRDDIRRALKRIARRPEPEAGTFGTPHEIADFRMTPKDDPVDQPTRFAFLRKDRLHSASVITQTVVVPEREIGVDPALLDEAVERMTNPNPLDVGRLSRLVTRLTVPRDFREHLGRARSLVCEVDRNTARIHWEMVCDLSEGASGALTFGQSVPMARQLRTAYSPAPAPAAARTRRALVIGDPGEGQWSLPGARREAIEVVSLLREKGFDVVALIGSPTDTDERLAEFSRASRLAVLEALLDGGFDLLHYAGHGDFDRESPENRAGWLFEGGRPLLARDIEMLERPPRLIVANACLSALVAGPRGEGRREADLLPGLADEFFRRGVQNYVGTAWEIDDAGAILFARTFYDRLLSPGWGATIGESLLEARKVLHERQELGSLWAAYQHYGDPNEHW